MRKNNSKIKHSADIQNTRKKKVIKTTRKENIFKLASLDDFGVVLFSKSRKQQKKHAEKLGNTRLPSKYYFSR